MKIDRNQLPYHQCDPEEAGPVFDGRNIYLFRACPDCYDAKLSQYRPDIMDWYDCDEPIESEDY